MVVVVVVAYSELVLGPGNRERCGRSVISTLSLVSAAAADLLVVIQ